MTITVNTPQLLRQYTNGVRVKADHHAPNVDAIWPCILGYAMAYAKQPLPVEVRDHHAEMALQAWAEFPHAGWISFSYRRKPTPRIVALKGNTPLATFTNATTARELQAFFQTL